MLPAVPLPPDLLRRDPEEASRRIALGLLDAVCSVRGRLDDASDADALHDYRVAMRRLRSILRSYGDLLGGKRIKKLRRALSELQRSTGQGRDAEVALAWLGPQREELGQGQLVGFDWLVARFTNRRRTTMGHVGGKHSRGFEALEKRLRRALLDMQVDLRDQRQRPPFAIDYATRIRQHFATVEARLAQVKSVDDADELHEARIAAKRFRYLVEPARAYTSGAKAVIKQLKHLQDILGDLNDTRMLAGEVDPSLEEGALARARRLGVEEVARRNRARQLALYGELEQHWVHEGLLALRKLMEGLACEIEAAVNEGLEIERKFLLTGRPEIPDGVKTKTIDQGYLPGETLRERVRKIVVGDSVQYVRTIKSGVGVSRFELEEETTQPIFDVLWGLTEGCRLRKIRHVVPVGDRVWEIDEFLDRDLYLAEIELQSADEVVEPPAWLAGVIDRDVTEDGAYTNLMLAR